MLFLRQAIWMIKCSVRLLPPIVTTLISVARSFAGACMWRVTADCRRCFQDDNTSQGTNLSSNCRVSNIHLSFVIGGSPTFACRMLVMRVPVRVPTSRQETGHGEKKSVPRLRRQKWSRSIMLLALSAVLISEAFS
jgi:hypothetical protein